MDHLTYKFGFYSAITAFAATVGYGVSQLLQIWKIITFPVDAILIYGFSLCIAIPFMLALLALHHAVPAEKKIWSHAAVLMSVLYAAYATFVYVIQLGVAIPRQLNGEAASIQVLVLTEHSFFWTLDALTYICMGISTFFAALAFEPKGSHKLLRWFLLANALLTPVIALIYFYPHFSTSLLLLGTPWLITAPGSMLLLAMFFKITMKKNIQEIYEEQEFLEVVI